MRLFALIFFGLGLAAVGRAQEVAFVINREAKFGSLSAEDVKAILLGTRVRFDDGTVVKLVVQTSGPVHEKVIREYTQRSIDQFEKYWKKQVFAGKGIMPIQCASDGQVMDYIARTPGAFGYVAKSSVTPAVAEVHLR